MQASKKALRTTQYKNMPKKRNSRNQVPLTPLCRATAGRAMFVGAMKADAEAQKAAATAIEFTMIFVRRYKLRCWVLSIVV